MDCASSLIEEEENEVFQDIERALEFWTGGGDKSGIETLNKVMKFIQDLHEKEEQEMREKYLNK